ncbi:MAG: hypothetical protein ABI186_09765 [Candidatus Elarobacter sp.]
MMVEQRVYGHPLRALMQKLRRPYALESDELGLRLKIALGAPTAYDALLITIERALHGHDSALKRIVQRCDVEGEVTRVVAAELFMSLRQFFRYRTMALEAIQTEVDRVLANGFAEISPSPKAAYAVSLGMYLISRCEQLETQNSLTYFKDAVIADPRLPGGWVGLAKAHALLALQGRDGALRLAAARKALEVARELAPRSPDVIAADALVTLWSTRSAAKVTPLVEEVLAADPRSAQAHAVQFWLDVFEGRFDRAAAAVARALATEPSNLRYQSMAVGLHVFEADYEALIPAARTILDWESSSWYVLAYVCEGLNALGRFEETLEAALPHVQGPNPDPSVVTAYARALAFLGDTQEAAAVTKKAPLVSVMRASVALALDDVAGAFTLLQTALAEDNGMVAVLPFDPAFAPIHDDRRFHTLIARYKA